MTTVLVGQLIAYALLLLAAFYNSRAIASMRRYEDDMGEFRKSLDNQAELLDKISGVLNDMEKTLEKRSVLLGEMQNNIARLHSETPDEEAHKRNED